MDRAHILQTLGIISFNVLSQKEGEIEITGYKIEELEALMAAKLEDEDWFSPKPWVSQRKQADQVVLKEIREPLYKAISDDFHTPGIQDIIGDYAGYAIRTPGVLMRPWVHSDRGSENLIS